MTTTDVARSVLAGFEVPPPTLVAPFERRGNINHDAFLVEWHERPRALLQRINTEVFALPDRVLANVERVTEAQRSAEVAEGWIVPRLHRSRVGSLGVTAAGGTWRLMEMIEPTRCHKSLAEVPSGDRAGLARAAGRGLARFLDATSSLAPEDVASSLPGYRDARLYLSQWRCAAEGLRECEDFLPDDRELQDSCRAHFAVRLPEWEWTLRRAEASPAIEIVEAHADWLTLLADHRDAGRVSSRVIHGDPKIENFLFHEESGDVAALIDLDTIMPHTWLVDWGDMCRSLVNVAGERERLPDHIAVATEIYAACAEGFLGEIRSATPYEVSLMPHAAAALALELGVRFLSDYLRGDTYFALGPDDPPDLNLVRGRAQITLFERLLDHLPEAQAIVGGSYAASAT